MKIKLIIAFVFVLALASFASAHTGEDESAHHSTMGGMMSGVYGYGFMWAFGWIFMVLVLVALVVLIIWLIKQIQKPNTRRRK